MKTGTKVKESVLAQGRTASAGSVFAVGGYGNDVWRRNAADLRVRASDHGLVVDEIILTLTFVTYTSVLLKKAWGISRLADACVGLFVILLGYVLLFSGQTRYILETGFQSFGTMIQNFPELVTFTDPLRKTAFPQNWTIY